MDPTLLPFFGPRGVVIVGASHDPAKLGYALASNVIACGYPGTIHLVNPRGGRAFDRPVHAEVGRVPDPVDLAAVIIPAESVPAALRACGERGIRAAVILSGGFREVGPEGAALEDECLGIARRYGMRLIGPNCVGLLHTHLPLDLTFLPAPAPQPGEVAFISHSGAVCAIVTDWARGQGFGLSHLVSLGNQADVTETDVLGSVAEDVHTKVLTLYLEGIGDGRRFVDEVGRAARLKPVIALKVGRSSGGQRAVTSHTGALAGQDVAYDAAFRRAGVIRAETIEQIFEWARAFAWCPLPAGRAVAVLTNAGGPGVLAADALERCGLDLAELREDTRRALRDLLPAAAGVHNPVDMLATATPEDYARCLRLLLDDPGVSGTLVILPRPPRHPAEHVVDAMVPVVKTAGKPVVVALMGEEGVRQAAERLRAARVPDYRSPERAASALAALTHRSEALARSPRSAVRVGNVQPETVGRLLAARAGEDAGPVLIEAGAILAAYGIPIARTELARTPSEAVALAAGMGYPVALKVASPDILHKTDVDGVLLDLPDAGAVAAGFDRLLQAVRAARPQARLAGVYIQRMLLPGQDVIVGAVADPQFGPLVMFGSGGVEVEELRDVTFELAPLSWEDAEDMLSRTSAGRRLRGIRGRPAADHSSVVDVIVRLAQLAADFPQIVEIEINPLRVFPGDGGAITVDARIRTSGRWGAPPGP